MTKPSQTTTGDPQALPVICYIGGIGRSGSTILDILLSQSPDVVGTGQIAGLHMETEGMCTCGQPIRECVVWGRVLDDLGETGLTTWMETHDLIFHERHFFRFLFSRSLCERLAGVSDQAMASISDHSNPRPKVLVDSSKNLSRAVALARGSHHRVRLLHLVRDSRGYVNSVNDYRSRRRQRALFFLPLLEWIVKNVLASAVVKRLLPTEDYLLIRFEDLMSRPVATLECIGRWLNIDVAAVVNIVEQEDPLERGHIFSGNRLIGRSHLTFEARDMDGLRVKGMNETLFWIMGGWTSWFWRKGSMPNIVGESRQR